MGFPFPVRTNMKVLLLIALFAAVIQTAKSETCLRPTPSKGKVFCYYTNGAKTWTEAKAWCTSQGKKIATIQHQEESDILKLAHEQDPGFHGEYWTAARDIQELEQFGWHLPNTKPEPLHYLYNPLLSNSNGLEFQTCLAYRSLQDVGLVMKKCTDKIDCLCE